MTEEQQAIVDLEATNSLLVAAVNVTKANIERRIEEGVTQAGDTVVAGMFSVISNSVETKTLFLKFINK
jgi:fructose-1-phosphate kinase PfkB-like protein